jgi:hypothetical protein
MTLTSEVFPAFWRPISDSSISCLKNRLPITSPSHHHNHHTKHRQMRKNRTKPSARLHNLFWDHIRTIKLNPNPKKLTTHKQTTEALSHRLPAKPIKKGFPYSHLAPTCPSIQRRAPCESHPPPPSSSSCCCSSLFTASFLPHTPRHLLLSKT